MEFAEMYLDLSSAGIRGDAEGSGFEGRIEVNDWAWGIAAEEASDSGQSDGGQAVGRSLTFRKPADSATTAMLSKLEKGERIPKASLVLVDRGQLGLALSFSFENVLLMSYDLEVESSDTEVGLSEVWVFNYEEIGIQYKGRPKLGEKRGSGAVQKFTLKNEWDSKMAAVELQAPPKPTKDEGGLSGVKEKELQAMVAKMVAEQLSKKR